MQVNDRSKNNRSITVIAVICFVLQIAVAPYLALGNARPNFAFVCCALVSMAIGGRSAVACGFAAGLVYDLTSAGPVGLMAGLLALCGFVLGSEARDRLSDDTMASLLPIGAASLAVSCLYALVLLCLGYLTSMVDAFLLRALPTTLLTVACLAPCMFIANRGRRGQHVSLGGSKSSRLDVPK